MTDRRSLWALFGLAMGLALLACAPALWSTEWPTLVARNMRIVGHNDLNGHGNGGEGLILRQYPNGRRILFLAHESAPLCFSVIDVTRPADPQVVTQIPIQAAGIRCNSLDLSNNILIVAHQTSQVGLPNGGIRIYDVADFSKPKELAFFDTSGPHSRGAHFVWFQDGRYAYVSTGAKDFVPTHPNDDQFLMIIDVQDPRKPREIGRWWLPGTREGDAEAPPPRLKFDTGYKLHTPFVSPDHPNLLYTGWTDGGAIILDITDRTKPKLVSRLSWYPPQVGMTHTVLPIFDRQMIVVAEESMLDKCTDAPKRLWMLDLRDLTKMQLGAVFPLPLNQDELCRQGGRSQAHNINLNKPTPFSRTLKQTVVGAFFNGGVRIYSIADPKRPQEIGYIIPETPPGNATGSIQINDLYVDEKGVIYANDRLTGGLYVLEYTGTIPLR